MLKRIVHFRLVLAAALGLSLFAVVGPVRGVIFDHVSVLLLNAFTDASRALTQEEQNEVEDEFLPFIGFRNLGVKNPSEAPPTEDSSVEQEADSSAARAVVRSVLPSAVPMPQSQRVGQGAVLMWAEAQAIPKGRSRPAEGGLPAGIELSDTAQLGIGLIDGDRLLQVNGVSVLQRGEVVREVLTARARGDEAIVALLARATPQGAQLFSVAIEQPYPHFEEGE